MNVEQIIKTKEKIPLETRTIIHLLLVYNKISEATAHTLKPYGVSREQFNVLRILQGQGDKPANLSTLTERMIFKMSNTTRLVDKLLAKGFVDRTICESNRRKVEIRITPEGKKALAGMSTAILQTEKELLKQFSKTDLEQLNRMLDKF